MLSKHTVGASPCQRCSSSLLAPSAVVLSGWLDITVVAHQAAASKLNADSIASYHCNLCFQHYSGVSPTHAVSRRLIVSQPSRLISSLHSPGAVDIAACLRLVLRESTASLSYQRLFSRVSWVLRTNCRWVPGAAVCWRNRI